MNASLKTMIGAAAMIAAGTLAAQTIELNKTTDWVKDPAIVEKDGTLTVTKQVMFVSAKTFDVDPNKTYTISLSGKAQDGKDKSWVLFGFNVFDKKGRTISCPTVSVVAGTETVLAADVKKGDKSILVKDASKWKSIGYYYICANAKADLSDLPNYNFIAAGIDKIEKKGNDWEVFFKKPVTADYPAGTMLRLHAGGGFLYTGSSAYLDGNWKVMTGSIKGMSKSGYASNVWPVSTAKAQIVILANWTNKKLDTQFKDISITIK